MRKIKNKFLYADAQYSDDGQMLYMEHYYEHSNGQKKSESYYILGMMHNENGPAHKEWYSNGELKYQEYWLDGIEYTKSEWILKIRNLKLKKLEKL